jgi:hypothetical protein
MKPGDIIEVECSFCGEVHKFSIRAFGKDNYEGQLDCVINNSRDCKKGIYSQWVKFK